MFWGSKSFQNLFSPISSELESLHDMVMVWLLLISLVVVVLSYFIFLNKNSTFIKMESTTLEVTWTLIPMGILVFIALPSLRLLNEMESDLPFNTVKLVSNQWNWQSEQKGSLVDHFLDSSKLDELSGYESPLLLPAFTKTRIMLTSSDVLHSLGMPSLGIKIDSTPGRLSAVSVQPYIYNLMVGSCYELCGSGHSAMPIFFLVSK